MNNPLRPILAGLERQIAVLERQAQARSNLAEKIREALPSPEKDHITSAAYDKGDLVLAADSAAWCARLRYCEEELRRSFAASGEISFTKLRLRVSKSVNKDE